MTKKTAATIIAEFLSWDIGDVTSQRYHPTRLASPAVYCIPLKHKIDGHDVEYLASPAQGQKMPNPYAGMKWELVGKHWHGREIWGATGQ